MTEQIQKQKCELCEKECWVLYPIIFGRDNFMAPRRGVCRECFDKAEDLDRELIMKSKKVAEGFIHEAEENLKFWKEELNKINSTRRKNNENNKR